MRGLSDDFYNKSVFTAWYKSLVRKRSDSIGERGGFSHKIISDSGLSIEVQMVVTADIELARMSAVSPVAIIRGQLGPRIS